MKFTTMIDLNELANKYDFLLKLSLGINSDQKNNIKFSPSEILGLSALVDMLQAHPPYPPIRDKLNEIVELELEYFAKLANGTLLESCNACSFNKDEAMNFTEVFLQVAKERSDEIDRLNNVTRYF